MLSEVEIVTVEDEDVEGESGEEGEEGEEVGKGRDMVLEDSVRWMLSRWERVASPPSSPPGHLIAAWWNVWPCGLPSVGTGETDRPSGGEGPGEEEEEEVGEGERSFGDRGSGRLLGFDSADFGFPEHNQNQQRQYKRYTSFPPSVIQLLWSLMEGRDLCVVLCCVAKRKGREKLCVCVAVF